MTIGFEALLRWTHPSKGWIPPGEFIPLAEERGLLSAVGSWVLQAACEQLAAWSTHPSLRHCYIAANVSAQQLHEADFVEQVLAFLHQTGAPPEPLKLELTESMLAQKVEVVIEKMLLLKQSGVSFSVEDFGSGYSSLAYLKRLPLDQLRIDQSFVRDIFVSPNAKVIARTIIGLGHALGLSVIAEGVETQEQQVALWESGCDASQGYYFGRPAPVEAFQVRLFVADIGGAGVLGLVPTGHK